jgi:hypothetical protein
MIKQQLLQSMSAVLAESGSTWPDKSMREDIGQKVQRNTGRTGEDVEAWLFQLEEQNRLFPIVDQLQRIRYTLSL